MSDNGKIEEAFVAGSQAWPEARLTREQFREAAAAAGISDFGEWAGDFYLACAAGLGDPAAIRLVDEQFIARLPARIRRLGAAPETVADVLQVVRERLFLGSAPRIRAYNATAPLAQWIKVVAIRTAIDLHRRELAAAPPAHYHREASRAVETDAQTRVMQQEYKHEFELALRGLIDALPARDRNVLRLHLIEQVSIEKLAVMYGVHRVTLARWVWNAGEILLTGLRRHFRERFGIELGEFDSLARLVRSQLSVDLGQLLDGKR